MVEDSSVGIAKALILVVLAYLGIEADADKILWYSYLLIADAVLYLMAAYVRKITTPADMFLRRIVKHLAIILLPVIVSYIVFSMGLDGGSILNMVTSTMIIWLGATSIGNIYFMFTGKRIDFDHIMVGMFDTLIDRLYSLKKPSN